MIQVSPNWRFIASFIAFATLAGWILALLGVGILTPSQILPAMKYCGIAAFAGVLAAITLNKHLWRVPFVRAFLHIPDLSGRWEGWRYRTLERDWSPTAHEITQSGLDIAAEAWGMKNWARSTSASIITDRHGGAVQLVWSYKAEVITPPSTVGGFHDGTHFLRLSRDSAQQRHLDGKYVNDRLRQDGTLGGVGFIRLVWVGRASQGQLAFRDEASWGMPEPQDSPIHEL